MNYINKYKITFTFYAVVLTLLFLKYLNNYLILKEYEPIFILVGIYIAAMFTGGFTIGYFDKEPTEGSKQSFVYHFITFVSVTSLSLPWFLFTLDFNMKNILYVLIQTTAWVLGLFFHWFFTHYKIKWSLIKL